MAILLGLDLETTGLDPATSDIIEVGAVLWDTDTQQPIQMTSWLIETEGLIPDEITSLTGITNGLIDIEALPELEAAINLLEEMVVKADYLVAHNAEFEKSFLKSFPEYISKYPELSNTKWIDTRTDLPYKGSKGKGSLSEIAMNHGIFNPMPHRALPDTLAMMQVLAQYDFSEVEIYANAPTRNLVIRFPYDATGEKNKVVKSLGYYWNPDGKYWHKPVKEFFVDEELGNAHAHGFVPDVLAA